ncbi:MAG: alanine--tRNA ligase-related protein, partial [Candidatus Magasanikbacteria bacterium]|nr:alanine--tRNA ligase-related protein [Candidatus Magasanikbacteria bacterium]
MSGKTYGERAEETFAFRVVMDHMRAATFLIGDGAVPSNKDQGYFTRRLIRRAVRFGHQLGIIQNFADSVSRAVIAAYAHAYPELKINQEKIVADFVKEEQKFRATLDKGLKVFEKQMEEIRSDVSKMSGQWLFDFYQNFGFPFELIIEELKTRGIKLSEDQISKMSGDFSSVFEEHKNLSRAGAEQKFKGGLGDHSDISVRYHTATHLLHATLKKVLGDHVQQKGSNITPERMRFDFSHNEKMTPEQIAEVENLINAAGTRDYPVSFEEMSVVQA